MKKNKPKDPRSLTKSVLQFSGIGLQMLVTILLFYYLGSKLDAGQSREQNSWTIGLTLAGVAVALYFMIKDLTRLIR